MTETSETAHITWEKAKEILDTMPEPSDQVTAHVKSSSGGSHEFGKQNHGLLGYEYNFKIGKYDACFNWSVCPECKKVWFKTLIVFNSQDNVCYLKEIIKKGKFVGG